MFLSRISQVLFASLIASAGLLLAPQDAAAEGGPASWAPVDTVFFVEIPSFDRLRVQWKKSLISRLMKDEQFRKLTGGGSGKLDEHLEELAKELGLENAEQLKVFPQGGVAVIVTVDPPTAGATEPVVHLAIVGDWGENSPKLAHLLEKIVGKLKADGGSESHEEYRGLTITTVKEAPEPPAPTSQPANGADTDPPAEQPTASTGNDDSPFADGVWFATSGTITAFANDLPTIKGVLDRIAGDGKDSFAQTSHYAGLRKHCAPLGEVNMVVNIPRLVEIGAKLDSNIKEANEMLALDSLGAFVATVAVAPKARVAAQMRGFISLGAERRGLARILTQQVVNKPLLNTQEFPRDTILALLYNIRFENLLDEIYELRKKSDPEGAEMLKAGLKMPLGEGKFIDLERLSKSFTLPLKLQFAFGQPYEPEDLSILLSVKHTSRESVSQLFEFPMASQFLAKRDLDGPSVYDVVMMMMPVGVSVAVTDDDFVIGNTPGINRMIRPADGPPTPKLGSDPQYQFTAQAGPPEAWYMIYVDTHKFLTAALKLHRRAKAAADGEEPPPSFSLDATTHVLDFMKDIPFDKVESPEALLKFAPAILSTATSVPGGILLHSIVTEPIAP